MNTCSNTCSSVNKHPHTYKYGVFTCSRGSSRHPGSLPAAEKTTQNGSAQAVSRTRIIRPSSRPPTGRRAVIAIGLHGLRIEAEKTLPADMQSDE